MPDLSPTKGKKKKSSKKKDILPSCFPRYSARLRRTRNARVDRKTAGPRVEGRGNEGRARRTNSPISFPLLLNWLLIISTWCDLALMASAAFRPTCFYGTYLSHAAQTVIAAWQARQLRGTRVGEGGVCKPSKAKQSSPPLNGRLFFPFVC